MGGGSWDRTIPVMGIPYHQHMKILGVTFASSIRASAEASWMPIATSVRILAKEAYTREMSLLQRSQYANVYLLAKVWFMSQNFAPPEECVRRINTGISWFLWKGSIFRVPLSTLWQAKKDGGIGLINMDAKCRALLMLQLKMLGGETAHKQNDG